MHRNMTVCGWIQQTGVTSHGIASTPCQTIFHSHGDSSCHGIADKESTIRRLRLKAATVSNGHTLRQWRESDLELYFAMNRDPEVMRYFPALLEREQSVASYARQRRLIDERGWGLWAVDVDGEFAGFTGLSVPTFVAPFTPCVEIGWRLRRPFWGRSIAYRAALQALDHGFRVAQLPGLVSFTAEINTPPRRSMERLGLTHDSAEDFDHPSIAEGSPIRRHVLYRAVPPTAAG